VDSISIGDLFILLVEPSSTQQKAITQHLHTLGVKNVDVVGSGNDALEAMLAGAPDLTISAMHLPDMTGAELVTKMRDNEATSEVPFMLVSSETSVRLLEPIRQAGVIAILPKPFELENLRDALLSAVDMLDPASITNVNDYDVDSLRVLIVDDSLTSRRHIRRILENIGIENFSEAEGGREGIEMISEMNFDLIVTDYNMPEVDGEELIRYVRQDSNQPSVPILMVTSEHDASRLAQVEQQGVSAICDKPFDPRGMLALLERII
jgi:two-component system chemotaxis response regulator CheY